MSDQKNRIFNFLKYFLYNISQDKKLFPREIKDRFKLQDALLPIFKESMIKILDIYQNQDIDFNERVKRFVNELHYDTLYSIEYARKITSSN